MCRIARLLLAVALCLSALPGWAAERRVALLRGDDELERALALALSAWQVETIPLDEDVPASAQPRAMEQASELARRLHLDGVVWISEAAEGSLLWIYDARSGETTTRVLAERPPFQSATAAGVALSVKTALRASFEPPPPATSPIPAPTPRAPEPPSPRVALKVALDAQLVAERTARPWFSFGSVVWLGRRRSYGAGLQFGASPALNIEGATFAGRFRELSLGPTLEVRLLDTARISISGLLGAGVQASLLDGTLAKDGARVEATRYHVRVDVGGQLDFRLGGGPFLGLHAQAAYFIGYDRYLVDGQPVFAPWRVVPSSGAHFGVEL